MIINPVKENISDTKEENGEIYHLIKYSCTCICHTGAGIKHIAPCCKNGVIEIWKKEE